MQMLRQFEDAIQVVPRTAILVALLGVSQGSVNQVFGENGFFAVRFVLWCARFEIKAERPALVSMEWN
jgi:hypothetical protein